MATEAGRAHLLDLRMQHRNLLRRRKGVLKEVGQEVEESRATGVHVVVSDSRLLPEDAVEIAMKQHRDAFANTEAQTKYRSTDEDCGHPAWQVKIRQGSRFTAMLTDQYGGRKAIRAFLRTGKLEGIRLPPTCAPAEGQRRAGPQRRNISANRSPGAW